MRIRIGHSPDRLIHVPKEPFAKAGQLMPIIDKLANMVITRKA